MNRRIFWIAATATAAVGLLAAVPLLAQSRQAQGQQAGQPRLDEHQAQEQRERDADAERAKRREAARAGRDGRDKTRPEKEEEERDPR